VQLFNSSAVALGYTLPPTVDVVSGVHYYTIGRTDASSVSQPILELSGNQTIEVFFGSNDVVVNGGTLTIVKNSYTALTNWIDIGGTGGPLYNGGANLSGSISSTSSPSAFNSFSTFALADKYGGANILPVGLLYFKAKPDHDRVALTWATAAETNNKYFSVEKSKDGQQFAFVQNISSAAPGGNSSTPIDYAAADTRPYPGLSYYRLKQTDLNGGYIYSPIVAVNFDKKPTVSIYPNPTAGKIYISGINESSLRIEWYDMSGRNLLQQTLPVQNGIVTINPTFTAGVYVLRYITADGNAKAQNIIIRR
jgi:hypothetical protein